MSVHLAGVRGSWGMGRNFGLGGQLRTRKGVLALGSLLTDEKPA